MEFRPKTHYFVEHCGIYNAPNTIAEILFFTFDKLFQ